MKTELRARARALRSHEGRSIKDIARLLRISQSSASVWVRDIKLTSDQRRRLVDRARVTRNASRTSHYRERRRAHQEHGRKLTHSGDELHVAGCMLYWAEGSKSRNVVQFTNSDPEMVRFFVAFLRRCYGVEDQQFRVDCNLFADHLGRQQEIEQFWLETLGLPATCLRKSTVNAYSKHSKRKRTNRLPYGTVRVCVHSTAVVQSIYGAIQEYASFERPEWLE